MEKNAQVMIIVPLEEWNSVKSSLDETLSILKELKSSESQSRQPASPYITAKEFMAAVRICRSNFDKLVSKGKIMTLKKGRKVYVATGEVERYFKEVEV